MNRSKMDLFESVDRFVMAAASDEPAVELGADFERMLQESEDACDLYIDCVQMSLLLPSLLAGEPEEDLGPDDAVLLGQARGLSPYTGLAFLGNAVQGTVGFFSSDWPVAYLAATVIFGIGLLIGSLVPVSQPVQVASQSSMPSRMDTEPKREVVGRITGLVDCKWADRATETSNGAHVPLGRKYSLASGLMEITYDTGARVILQGPVTYEMEANGGYLSVGKLTGKLDKEGGERGTGDEASLHPSSFILHPFVIRTPTATVTDLGTEFGVEVGKEGNTMSHVFRGSVELVVDAGDGKTEEVAQVLHENESARVENSGGNRIVMLGPSVQPVNFVRQIHQQTVKMFDLVDVVAGGDGFSGRRKGGIDPTNGEATNTPPVPKDKLFWLTGDGQYHRVKALPFVDGVFIPNGRAGQVQIDSAGHAFDGFFDSDGTTSGYVWAGGEIPAQAPVVIRTELDGVDYATAGHGLLFLHANKGITFDLQAIRRANPDRNLLRFRAMAGNTERISENGAPVYADIWVLVDGQPRFQRRQISRFNGAFSIVIRIAEKDRFLTLAATDGGNGIAADWIVFGDPRLELASVANGPAKDTTGR